jgi:hypothetical protein
MEFRIEKERLLVIVRSLRIVTEKPVRAEDFDPGDEPKRRECHGDPV